MPTYDYKCKECQSVQELRHSHKEDPEVKCVKCGSIDTFRVMSGGTGVIYKPNKGGLRISPHKPTWDWAGKRSTPMQGHRLTAEERKEIEDRTVNKQIKRIEEASKPDLKKVVSNIMASDAKKGEK